MTSKQSHTRSGWYRLWVEELEPRRLLSGSQPTAAEQLLLEQLNDIRANPAAYGASINVDLSGVAPEAPLAFNPLLVEAAQQHAQDMNARGYFSQNTPEGVSPGERLNNLGFTWVSYGESSAAGSKYPTSASALQTLIVDASSATLADRDQLLAIDALFKTQTEVGVGIVQGGTGPLTNYYTIDTASTSDGRPFLSGVVFTDTQGTGKYAIGEGLGNVVITVAGPESLSTVTWGSGGYSLQLSPGTYTVTASGGDLVAPVKQTVTIGISNVALNFVLPVTALHSGSGAWLELLYRDLLGRAPSTGEVNGWLAGLQGGTSYATIASDFLGSREYTQDLVTQWYQSYLRRAPDGAGLSGFTNALLTGTSEDAVREAILSSPEFLATSGGTPTTFAQTLYQDLLGRLPAGAEASGWIAMAGTASGRAAVVSDIVMSGEAITNEVGTFYATYLRRAADANGLSGFVNLIASGHDERQALGLILSSQEYVGAAQDILWLQGVYRDVLGRNGDNVNELGAWLSLLRSGVDRTSIATAIAGSAEADTRVVTGMYERLLHRQPDAPGLSYFVHLLQTGSSAADVVDMIVSSPEYFKHQGGTNTEFVVGMYNDLLSRVPLDFELSAAISALNSGDTLLQVVQSVTASAEYQADYISNLFLLYLRRAPSNSELAQYLGMVTNGSSDAAIIGSLTGSDEYFAFYAG